MTGLSAVAGADGPHHPSSHDSDQRRAADAGIWAHGVDHHSARWRLCLLAERQQPEFKRMLRRCTRRGPAEARSSPGLARSGDPPPAVSR